MNRMRAQGPADRVRGGGASRPGEAAGKAAPVEISIAFDDNDLAMKVLGQFDQNIARLERRLGVVASQNGNHVSIRGAAADAQRARRVVERLQEHARLGHAPSISDVDGAVEEDLAQGTLFPDEANPQRGASR